MGQSHTGERSRHAWIDTGRRDRRDGRRHHHKPAPPHGSNPVFTIAIFVDTCPTPRVTTKTPEPGSGTTLTVTRTLVSLTGAGSRGTPSGLLIWWESPAAQSAAPPLATWRLRAHLVGSYLAGISLQPYWFQRAYGNTRQTVIRSSQRFFSQSTNGETGSEAFSSRRALDHGLIHGVQTTATINQ